MYLAKMTTVQAKEAFLKDPIIVIPVGSTEQHGTQSALGTDFMVPSYLADHVEDVENVIVAPTVPYGVCPYHLSFEGSINIGYEGLYFYRLKKQEPRCSKQPVREPLRELLP